MPDLFSNFVEEFSSGTTFNNMNSNSMVNHPIWKDIEDYWDYEKNIVKPKEVTIGAHNKFYLKCKNNHSVSISAPSIIKMGAFKCKWCLKLPYTHPEYIKYWDYEKNEKDVNEVGSGQGKAWWLCDEGHSFEMDVHNKIRSKPDNCPICSGRAVKMPKESLLKTIHPELEKLYSVDNKINFSKISIKRKSYLLWDFHCGHSYKTSIAQMIKHNGTCKFCENREFLPGFNSLDKTHPNIIRQWSNKNTVNISEVFYRTNKAFYWKCQKCHYVFKQSPITRIEERHGCPVCCGNVIKEGVNDVTTFAPEFIKFFNEEKSGKKVTEMGKSHRVFVNCPEGHSYEVKVKYFIWGLAPCRVCHPRSKCQDELTEYISELLPNNKLMRDTRTIIKPLELDIWLPELKVGIEFNGDYYHGEKYIRDTKGISALEYHTLKLAKAKEKGIELLFVWESDWRNSQELVKSALEGVLVSGENFSEELFHKLTLD